MFYEYENVQHEPTLIILKQITRIGWPNLDCIRIAKINMYSLEMCHKSTTQESEREQKNTKEKKEPANTLFTHANVIRTLEWLVAQTWRNIFIARQK